MTASSDISDYDDADEADLLRLVRELQRHESQYYDRMIDPEKISGWYVDDLHKQCREFDGRIRVVRVDGRIAGYSTVLTRCVNEEPDELDFSYCLVGDLSVEASMRGKGLGRALLEDAEIIARQTGARWLRISVLAGNTLAREVYTRYGFREHLVEMEKPLT
jgi:GNAT superfamily N-acetyltransferase